LVIAEENGRKQRGAGAVNNSANVHEHNVFVAGLTFSQAAPCCVISP